MKIAILADDFSGAAELAGIAAARGLSAEVQTRFDPGSDAEVIAIDTDTRLRPEEEAVAVATEVAGRVIEAQPDWIFKKTDSVLRGHVRAEVEAILSVTGREDCLLIPANPSKGRVIHEGRYRIEGKPLHETVFANDPDHPIQTDIVADLLGGASMITVPDIFQVSDIPETILPSTLPAGAADFFTRLLGERKQVERRLVSERTLVVCGSLAAWESGRANQLKAQGYRSFTIEDRPDETEWQRSSRLLLGIGKGSQDSPEELLQRLVDRATVLMRGASGLRIAIEGGATAHHFFRTLGWERFEVIPENHVGVGTLRTVDGQVISVKPGSYPWPDSLLG